MKYFLDYKSIFLLDFVNKVGDFVKCFDGKLELLILNNGMNNDSLNVCLEEYKGSKFGYLFYFIGWVFINCINVKLFSFVISVLINIVVYLKEDDKYICNVIKGINDIYLIV